MRAIILAAGRGSRLGAGSDDLPKCLLEVGRRRLIEHQLETLSEAGVGPVLMVLGYCADEIREVVGIQAEYIVNSRWSSTNSLYSFSLAKEWSSGPVLVLNSDILIAPDVLAQVLKTEGDCIAYDSSSGDGGEHMKVEVLDGRLLDMSKTLPPERVAGENVGLLKFTEETADRLFDLSRELVDSGHENDWLGRAVCEIARERQIGAVDIAPLPWGEIDFPYDLVRVRKEVWPAIQKQRPARRFARRFLPAACLAIFAYLGLHFGAGLTESTWDVVDAGSTEHVEIQAGEQVRRWTRLNKNAPAEFYLQGPTVLRIDSRLLRTTESSEESEPYVLEVSIDGELVDWFKESGVPSKTWSHDDRVVCKRRRVKLDIPEGEHRVEVRLVASLSGECLVKMSRKESEETVD